MKYTEATQTRRTYSADVYRDDIENEEAAAESRTIGDRFETVEEARDAIREAIRLDGWHYGSIHLGDFDPGVLGVRPALFESDLNESPWQVGPDWFDRG